MLAHRARGVEEGFARLDMLKHRARVPVGSGPDGGAEALQMEKSPASGRPEGPCGTQISAGRQRSRPEGSGGAGVVAVVGLLLNWSQGAAVAGDVVEYVPNGVVAAMHERAWSPPSVLSLPAEWAK